MATFFARITILLLITISIPLYSLQRNPFHEGVHLLGGIVKDAVMLNMALFSTTSLKVITGFMPIYLAARMVDEKVQCHFHDRIHHKNINQLPTTCHRMARFGVGIPMVLLSSLALFGWNEDVRMTARIFAIGLPFVQSGKDIIKSLRFKACLRPWHENFDHKQRSSGGFPSGHLANVSYAATLFGMRYGWKWALPLGALASFVFVDFANCNRHYISQLVAGVGLGVMFAFAANTVIEKKLDEIWSCNLEVNNNYVGLRASYCF